MDTTPDDLVAVNLLRYETVQLRSPTLPRATFYEGTPPMEFIRSKVTEIFRKNPWLQGRLVRGKGRVVLQYPREAGPIDRYLRVVSIPSLRFDTSFPDFTTALKDLVPKRGNLCLDKDEELFRVTVVNISENRFAVVMATSHVFADGHTFYQIHRMLSADEPVRPLIVERVYSSRDDIDAAIRGGDDALPWMSSPRFLANVAGTLLRRRPLTLNLFSVDRDAIERIRQEYAATHSPKFISSNDILASEFFAKTDCDLMFMTINFRDRIPHLTSDHAGNYQTLIAFQKEDFASPELIRTAFSGYRRAISGDLPGFFKSTRLKLGGFTNLSGFYKNVELPGCRLLAHRMVIVDSLPLLPFDYSAFVFKSNESEMSMITATRNPAVLANMPILKERVV